MSLELFLYLVSVLGNVSCACQLVVWLGVLGVVVGAFVSAMIWDTCGRESLDNFKEKRNKLVKVVVPIMSIAFALSILIPSKKTMYAIGFSHYAKQTQISQKLMDLLNQKLDDALGGEKL